MTDTEVQAPSTDAQADDPTRRGRGRPRPSETIDRDNTVYEHLAEPGTRAQLADRTGLTKSQVYLSLWRLNRDGRVSRGRSGGDHVWSRTGPNSPGAPPAGTVEQAPTGASPPAG